MPRTSTRVSSEERSTKVRVDRRSSQHDVGPTLPIATFAGLADLIAMMDTLIDKDGNILVEGLMDTVAPVTEAEKKKYENISFDPEDYRKDIGTAKLIHNQDKTKTLMARWRFPSLSLHGIQGAFSDPGAKTVIPRKVIGASECFPKVTTTIS